MAPPDGGNSGPGTAVAPSRPEAEILKEALQPALKDLQQPQREKIIRTVNTVLAEYRGPLPPPEMLANYDRAVPNGAERIVRLWEQQSAHRQECEKAEIELERKALSIAELEVKNEGWLSKVGQILGFIIAISFLAAAVGLALANHDWVAGLLGGGGLATLVGVFIYGHREKKSNGAEPQPSKPPQPPAPISKSGKPKKR